MAYNIPTGNDAATYAAIFNIVNNIVSDSVTPRPSKIIGDVWTGEFSNANSSHDSSMYYESIIWGCYDTTSSRTPRFVMKSCNSYLSKDDKDLRPFIIKESDDDIRFFACLLSDTVSDSKLQNSIKNYNNAGSDESYSYEMTAGSGYYSLSDYPKIKDSWIYAPNANWNVTSSKKFFITENFPHDETTLCFKLLYDPSLTGFLYESLQAKIISNAPIFDNHDAAAKWILYGDRSGELIDIPSCDYTLFIDGERLPNYNLNWNPDALGKFSKDAKVYLDFSCLSRHPLDPMYEHGIIKTFPFTDGSIKFNWSDIWQEIDAKLPVIDNILNNKFKVEINAIIDNSNVRIIKDEVSVDLHEKKNLLGELYENLVSPSVTGDTLTIDFGEGKDSDDYYDTDSGENDEHSPTTGYDIGACNLTACYELSVERLNNIAIKLWSEDFFSNILLLNNSPIENILSCKLLPLSLSGSENPVKIGNVDMGINGNRLSKTVYRYNIGTISIPRISDMGFLNYAPYTSIVIFLPFIGFKELNTSDIMGRNVSVDYIVDVITGACKAIITVNNYQCYEFDGNCGIDIPLTAGNRSQVEMGYVKAAVGVVSNIASKNIGGAISSGISGAMQQYHYSTNGSYSPSTGAYEDRTCFIIIDRPQYTEVSKFGHTKGYKCQLSKTIGSLKGFVKTTENVDLSNISAPEYCKKKILDLLSSGIYV